MPLGLVLAVAPAADANYAGENGLIAFHATVDDNTDIYVIHADGTGLVRLTSDPAPELAPAWSPDGTKIAYLRLDPEEEQYSLYVMHGDGSHASRLLQGQVGRYRPRTPIAPPYPLVSQYSRPNAVSWSPDAKSILYSRARPAIMFPPGELDQGGTDESYAGELHLIGADGSGDRDIPCSAEWFLCDRNEQGGRFSWDGSEIGMNVDDYCPDCAGGAWTVISNADGSNPRVFPRTESEDVPSDLTWAPDGSAIAFVRNQRLLVSADPTGSAETTLLAAPTAGLQWPQYSPDGAQLVYEHSGLLYVIAADGSDNTLVTIGSRPDWQSLSSRVSAPPRGSVVRTNALHVEAEVTAGIDRVSFRACSGTCTYAHAPVQWGTVGSAPFSQNYPLAMLPDGPVTICARAFMSDGASVDLSPVTITLTLDRAPPSVSIIAGPREAPSDRVFVTPTVSDADSPITRVGFRYCHQPNANCSYDSATPLTTRYAAPFSAYVYPPAGPEPLSIIARAWDAAGNTADSLAAQL